MIYLEPWHNHQNSFFRHIHGYSYIQGHSGIFSNVQAYLGTLSHIEVYLGFIEVYGAIIRNIRSFA